MPKSFNAFLLQTCNYAGSYFVSVKLISSFLVKICAKNIWLLIFIFYSIYLTQLHISQKKTPLRLKLNVGMIV